MTMTEVEAAAAGANSTTPTQTPDDSAVQAGKEGTEEEGEEDMGAGEEEVWRTFHIF